MICTDSKLSRVLLNYFKFCFVVLSSNMIFTCKIVAILIGVMKFRGGNECHEKNWPLYVVAVLNEASQLWQNA